MNKDSEERRDKEEEKAEKLVDVTPGCHIRIDKEGKWWYEDKEIIHPAIYKFFNEQLRKDDEGRYFIRVKNQICYIEVEDAPFVVTYAARIDYPDGSPSRYLIKLNDGTQETLDLSSLSIGKDNVMYCMVKGGRFKARFLRPAYYQITSFIEEEPRTGRFFIRSGNRKFYIRTEN